MIFKADGDVSMSLCDIFVPKYSLSLSSKRDKLYVHERLVFSRPSDTLPSLR